ncbi:helix-turn-helix domain-containing protein [Williamsia deligens]|uniref:Helix-turn-helix domain-containing protein n=1 Tax=Williamsia deligens TaxID=321325 RepID=A0ABW3G2Y6_9NOCA
MDELSVMLRAWRDRVRPEHVGLPAGLNRRAPGLRREELAALADVSVDYIVRLEQGRSTHPSGQMVAALARALRLRETERDALYRAAGLAVPTAQTISTHITPGVARIVDRLGDVPLAVFTAAWDILLWNPLWAAMTGDPSARKSLERNVAWQHFVGEYAAIRYDDDHREEFSDDLAADLRTARMRYPADARLDDLIRRLRSASDDFDRRWGQVHVAEHKSSRKTAITPAGPILVDCDVLTAPGTDLRIVVYTTAPDSEDSRKVDLLRVVGLQTLA